MKNLRLVGALIATLPFVAGCGTTPLNLAIQRKDFPEVQRLVESGADVNKLGGFGHSTAPLPQAVNHGTPQIAAYLAKKGAGYHLLSMMLATHLDSPQMYDALLDNGVQVPPSLLVNQRIQYTLNRRAARATAASHGNLDNAASDRMRASASMAQEKREPSSDVDTPSRRGAERPDDFALVIGIEDYQSLPKADYGVRDAKTMRLHLEALGFPPRNIISLEGPQATGNKLKSYLEEWLPLNVKPGSTLFVFYSGHGAPDPKTGDAYLVPWDGDASFLKSTAYPLSKFYADLSKTKAKRVLVALDACFSGAGGRSVLAEGARPLVAKVAQTPAGGRVTVLAAASGEEITGSLNEQGHGMFTYFLLKALSEGKRTAKELHDSLSPRVQDEARRQNRQQTPSLIGDDVPL